MNGIQEKKNAELIGNICAWIYLFEILQESEKVITYKDGKKLIGFCGYSKDNSKRYLIRKKFYEIIKNILYRSKKIKDINALKEYENNYNYMPKKLENCFDGEISILIVDKKYRRKNIGKKLLFKAFDLAKKDKMNKLVILSDESCNYKFYEKCGCEKICETIVQNKEYGQLGKVTNAKAFIYEKKL